MIHENMTVIHENMTVDEHNDATRANAREHTAAIIARGNRAELQRALVAAEKDLEWKEAASRRDECSQVALDMARERVDSLTAAVEEAVVDKEHKWEPDEAMAKVALHLAAQHSGPWARRSRD